MPRARISDTEEEIVLPKPKTRKPRVIPADGEIKVVRKRAAPRARVINNDTTSASALRKAPTPLASNRKNRSRNSKTLFTILGLCTLLGVTGVGIGFMDSGTIDVVAVVNERNEKINKGEIRDEAGQVVSQTLQVQNADSRPNGGLKLGDAPVATPAVVEEASTTQATSTPAAVSTTTDPLEQTASEPAV